MAAKKKGPSASQMFAQWSAGVDRRNEQRSSQFAGMEKALLDEGLSPEQISQMRDQYIETGKLNTESLDSFGGEESAPVVPQSAANMPQMSAISAQEAYNRDDTGFAERVGDFGANLRAGAREGLAALLEAPVGLLNAASYASVRPMEKLTGLDFGSGDRVAQPEFITDEAKRLRQDARDIRILETSSGAKAAANVLDEAEGFTGTVGALARNPGLLSDQLGQQVGQMLPTIAGGPSAKGIVAVSAVQAGAQNANETYERAKAKGMSDEDAGRAADLAYTVSAGANALIPTITPGGTALEKLMTGQLTKEALGTTSSVALKPIIGEAATEAFTEGLEELGSNVAVGDPWSQNLGKAAALGMALGTAMGAGPAAIRAKQNREGWASLEEQARFNAQRYSDQAQQEAQANAALQQQPEPAPVPTTEEAFTARENEQAAQKAAQEEEMFRQMDAANNAAVRGAELRDAASANQGSSLAQQLAGIGTQITRKAPVEVQPEVAPEPTAEEVAAQDAATKEATRIVSREKAATEKAAADNLKAYKKEYDTKRKAEVARIAEESKSITDPDARVKSVADSIVAWDRANPVPTAVPDGWAPAKAPTVPKRKAPAKQEAKVVNAPAPVEAEVKTTGPLDDRIKALTNKMGLQMEESAAKTGTTPNVRKFKNSANNVITELVRKGDASAASVLRLVDQGKLVLAPNPESVGVDASDNGAAMYVPKDGKMYLWTDRAKKGDATGNIIKAMHEATHAGQFNKRADRTTVMQQIMGKNKAESAENTIRAAAKKGNVLAKRAVAAAEKAAPQGTDVNSLEVLPYFVGEVAKSRSTSLGSLNSLGRDILAGAKKLVKGAGVDTDVSFNDVYVATKDVANEIAETKLEPQDYKPVEMIYPKTAAGFEQAKEDGRVYVNETGHELFVLSDADSQIKPKGIELLQDLGPGEVYALPDIFYHPTLFHQMPSAKNILVGVTEGMSAWGRYHPGEDFVELSSAVVDGKTSVTPREIILHEIQHWVQEQAGRTNEMMKKSDAKLSPSEEEAVQKFKAANTEIQKLSRKVLDQASVIGKALPSAEEKRAVMKAITNQDNPIQYRAEALLDIAATLPSMPSEVIELASEFNKAMQDWRTKTDARNAALKAQRKRYINNVTEGEAFFTQAYASAPQEAIPINPELDPSYKSEKYAKGDLVRQAKEKKAGLEMQDDEDAKPKTRKVPAFITGLFRADKGLSKEHNEIIEYAVTSPAGRRMEAEAMMGRYDKAVRELADAEGISVKEMNKKIEDALAEIDPDLEGWDANLEAFDKVANKFGEAGIALRELRDLADNLSLLMLEQRAEDPKPLTEMEKKVYSKVSSNLGRYTHRSYAANSGELGKMYSNALWKDYQKFKKDGADEKNPAVENNYNTVNNAIDTLVNDSLLIPDDEKLYRTTPDRIDSLYRTWGKNGRTEGMSIDAKREELADIRDQINGDSDALTREAENIVRELLNLDKNEGPITTYYRGSKQNNSILKKRENIPESIRKLMGEITEPGMKFVTTVAKQSQYLAANKMMLELANSPGNDLLPPGSSRPEGWTALTGEGYGPLEGYIASPNMQAAIGDVKQQIATFEQLVGMMGRDPKGFWRSAISKGADLWGTAASTSKMMQIIFNPANLVFNFGGGAATMLMNGNVNPKYLGAAMRDAYDLVQYSVSPTNATEAATELVKYDIVDSAFVGEIKNEQYRALRTLVRDMAGRERSPTAQTIANTFNAGKAGWKETYAMMDVTFKIANFHKEVDFLRDFYDKQGIERTDEQIKREAADVTKRTNFTFRRVAPVLKALEAGGMTAFGPYMHEVFRTQGANILQGVSEIKRANTITDPDAANAMRMRGVSRLTGQAVLWGLTGMASLALAKATFGDDEDEEKKLRALLGDMYGDQDFIQVGTDKNGYPVLMAWSRTDPYGPITDFMRAALNQQADVGELIGKMKDIYITPRLIPQLFKAYEAFADDKKPSRKPWAQTASTGLAEKTGLPDLYSELMDIGETVGLDRRETKALTNVLENLYGPGIMTSWRDTNARPVEQDAQGMALRAASYGGFTFQTLDPTKPLTFAAMDYGNAVKTGRSKLTEFFQDNTDRSENEIVRAILRQRRIEQEEFKDAREVYEGALAAGMTKREIAGILKSARLTTEGINALASGEFDSHVISKKSIDASKQQELATAPRKEHAEIKEKWNNIWQLLNGANRATEEK